VRFYRHYVTPEFFPTLRIVIVRGRGFATSDIRGGAHVVILSESGARRLFPGEDALGRTLPLRSGPVLEATVVGVARDARFRNLTSNLGAAGAEPDMFFPFVQRTDANLEIAVRSRTAGLISQETLIAEVAALDPALPLYRVAPLAESLRRQTAIARFGSFLLIVFSSVALILAAIGLYGIIAFVVGLNRREIAIRMALGAESSAVRRLVIRNAMTLVAAGVVTGLVMAGMLSRVLANLLFAVSPRDPMTFAAVAAAVLGIAFIASYVPARRAAQVDPQLALKSD